MHRLVLCAGLFCSGAFLCAMNRTNSTDKNGNLQNNAKMLDQKTTLWSIIIATFNAREAGRKVVPGSKKRQEAPAVVGGLSSQTEGQTEGGEIFSQPRKKHKKEVRTPKKAPLGTVKTSTNKSPEMLVQALDPKTVDSIIVALFKVRETRRNVTSSDVSKIFTDHGVTGLPTKPREIGKLIRFMPRLHVAMATLNQMTSSEFVKYKRAVLSHDGLPEQQTEIEEPIPLKPPVVIEVESPEGLMKMLDQKTLWSIIIAIFKVRAAGKKLTLHKIKTIFANHGITDPPKSPQGGSRLLKMMLQATAMASLNRITPPEARALALFGGLSQQNFSTNSGKQDNNRPEDDIGQYLA